MNRPYAKLTITKKGERAARSGHPWVYGEEVTHVEGTYQTGDIVDVYSDKDRYLGTGFANDISKIRVRIVSRNANDRFDEAFWQRRVKYALDYRKTVMGDKDFACCRLIFGDADDMPGLTVDRYNDVLVAQTLCYGMDQVKPVIFKALVDELAAMGVTIRGIYERNDVKVRELDGMEEYKGWYQADFLPQPGSVLTTIDENGILYDVDVENGQKTGFFLDQKYNRLAVAKIAAGKHVLDCFTHTGAFALNAAKGGAASVTAVDISQEAVDMTNENIRRNGLEDIVTAKQANVFDLLTDLADHKCHDYDFIILDPPAFTKSGHTVHNAIRGYKEINLKAMKLLPRGGYLATCSCSHFMRDDLFRRMLHDAAKDAGVRLRQIEGRQQSPDHPILWNVPETNYLKFYLFQVV
ncbi:MULTISPECIES: class I SAM-dependent rRNA methyltransferase [Megasphaera]|jgi:23S rRNA (cytosine1962-C5)-methyltransferase|uniref:Class I SAM-dependent rRNA methyltransferase n=2 Tax=Megasphaera TaxID=906 RepID=A0ABV1CWV5_9FIRM|nr:MULTISPECIES: class I SAM-dependent rRNA methyltransferase [unclassified Megasphaera]MBD9021138.1 class I SAM-dependent rRNA methyltransferase [Megasphaera elsdenii]MCH3902828.1 class I SAM-dependent rRNA methyltransferase [Limosilactobacillus oris]MCI1887723.1 class I SAM-dependent rRNA methyltransferase [Sporolactobacillus sp.]MCI1905556.1 class I SAM-dependent rRNA methyltransferase [Enterococcaceae bacterium]DAV63384.1 MAG TPA: putative SAM-dependent methyltransferase [Caudoviricetes sp